MVKKHTDREVALKENGQTYEGVLYMILGYDKKNGEVLQTLAGDDFWLEVLDDNYPGIRKDLEAIAMEELVPICEKIRAVIDSYGNRGVHQ